MKTRLLLTAMFFLAVLCAAAAAHAQITPSGNPSLVGQTVTFTFTVTPQVQTSASPTGTITFSDNGSFVVTGTVQNGTATGSITFTTTGDHTVTAAYSGDQNFGPSTGTIIETVAASNIFTLSATPTSLTQPAGGQSTTDVTLFQTAAGNASVHLSCDGLPAGATCVFLQTDLLPSSTGAKTLLTISSTAKQQASANTAPGTYLFAALCIAMGLILVPNHRSYLLAFAFALCFIVTGCGGHTKFLSETPAGTYSVHVVGTSSSLSQESTVQLTVK
ncbi:MAG TPA: Ig-like domain-containing protein [Candidatus Angelobacter sp.]|nr:Ig-like domain-containing protein [Candidatus Angelobacter sp.]